MQAEPSRDAGSRQSSRERNRQVPLKKGRPQDLFHPQNNLSAVQDNLFLSQLPTRIVIGLVDSAAFNGHYTKNPFNFRPNGLSFLPLFLEGKQILAKPLTTSCTSARFSTCLRVQRR